VQLEKEMIQKPQVLSTGRLRLAGSPRAQALARQQEPPARAESGISPERTVRSPALDMICTTGAQRRFQERSQHYPPDCCHQARKKSKSRFNIQEGD